MTTTENTREHDMTALYRVEIKANGIVVWTISSESGHDYRTTVFEDRVTSCERADGEPCKSWRYRRSCHHATLALQRESERKAERRAEEQLRAQDVSTSQKGSLHSSKPFSLYR